MDEVEFYLKDLASRFKAIDKQKYYLSYSGGKDSHFLYWFIKEYLKDDQIEIVAVNTYMEHTAIRKRMYDNADTILLPKFKPFEIKEKYGSPCFTKDKKFTPLHDLSDELLENIYKKYRIEIPEIYNYIDRTGCMGCPYGSYKGYTKKELDLLSEQQRKFAIEYFKESYDVLGIDYKNKDPVQTTIFDYL